MAGFNFADSYRMAGLTPSPDILRLREGPFDKVRKALDAKTAIDLVRLYFGLAVPRGTDWFRDAFQESDTSFSMYDNQREASVLAACLLIAAIADGKAYASLALLTTAAAGARQPPVMADLLEQARQSLTEKGIKDRQREPANPEIIKLPAKSKASAELAALIQTPEIAKAAALIQSVSEEANENTKNLANQTAWVTRPMAAQVADLREEVDMLWWYFGGWSRVLERAFSELEPGLAAAMAGLDLADLCRTLVGPAAAPAILQRLISGGRKGKIPKVTIKEAVDGFPKSDFEKLELETALSEVPDICPVLTGFAKAKEIDDAAAWPAAFLKAANLDASTSFQALELAMQVYRERLLLSALG